MRFSEICEAMQSGEAVSADAIQRICPDGIWYHGTGETNFVLAPESTGRRGDMLGKAFYLTNSEDYAKDFATAGVIKVKITGDLRAMFEPPMTRDPNMRGSYGEHIKRMAIQKGFNAMVGRIGPSDYQLAIYDPRIVEILTPSQAVT